MFSSIRSIKRINSVSKYNYATYQAVEIEKGRWSNRESINNMPSLSIEKQRMEEEWKREQRIENEKWRRKQKIEDEKWKKEQMQTMNDNKNHSTNDLLLWAWILSDSEHHHEHKHEHHQHYHQHEHHHDNHYYNSNNDSHSTSSNYLFGDDE